MASVARTWRVRIRWPENAVKGLLAVALDDACHAFPMRTALTGGARGLTFAELGDAAGQVESALHSAKIQPDEPVHVRVANRPLDIAALLGVWRAGAVAVPVHRSMPPAVAQQLFERTGSRLCLDAGDGDQVPPGSLAVTSAVPPAHRPLLRNAAAVIFTSGSTGNPKGVVVRHEAFHGKIGQIDRLLQFGRGESTLLVLNITFSFGLWVSLLTLLRGGTLHMKEKFEPAAFSQWVCDERIDRVGVVPTMMRALFALPGADEAAARIERSGALRQILIGGESLGRSLADTIRQRFASTALIDIYGLTETSTCDFFAFPDDYARYPGAIGRPAPGVSHRIVSEEGAVVNRGDVGELQLRSPYLMAGYLDEPALTAASFQDGWFRTGDIAREAGPGVVELMGRSKEIIVRGGNKITPVEIEQALTAHPAIAAAMAVGVADRLLGERIHALLVPRAGTPLEMAALSVFLRDRLERFKHPDAYYVLDALPLGRTGKADRGQFKRLVEAGEIAPLELPSTTTDPLI